VRRTDPVEEPISYESVEGLHQLFEKVLADKGQPGNDEYAEIKVGNLTMYFHKETAQRWEDSFRDFVNTYNRASDEMPEAVSPLTEGPSYIHLGAALGSQRDAFIFMGLGQYYGLWRTFTPSDLNFSPEETAALMGMGFICLTGYERPEYDH
jgi:hypothetical protein